MSQSNKFLASGTRPTINLDELFRFGTHSTFSFPNSLYVEIGLNAETGRKMLLTHGGKDIDEFLRQIELSQREKTGTGIVELNRANLRYLRHILRSADDFVSAGKIWSKKDGHVISKKKVERFSQRVVEVRKRLDAAERFLEQEYGIVRNPALDFDHERIMKLVSELSKAVTYLRTRNSDFGFDDDTPRVARAAVIGALRELLVILGGEDAEPPPTMNKTDVEAAGALLNKAAEAEKATGTIRKLMENCQAIVRMLLNMA